MFLSNISPLGIALFLFVSLQVLTLIAVLTQRETWKRRLVWALVVSSVPVFGPLYFLLFREDWKDTTGQS